MAPSDEHLMEQVLARSTDAFEALFARYQAIVRRHLLHTVRNEAAADDLVQELFLRVWTRAEQWQGRGPFKAWLFRIATNLALNYLRTVQRRREQALDFPPAMTETDDESPVPSWMIDAAALGPDTLLEQIEQRQLLWRWIAELPEEQREIVRLVHEAEMDTRSVAGILGIPQGTVKSRLHYAMKRLAQEWKDLTAEWEETE